MNGSERAPGYVPNPAYTQDDWDDVGDTPELTDAELTELRPGPEGLPPEMRSAFAERALRSRTEAHGVPVSLRVDPDVLAAYQADGPGWQARMSTALAEGLARGRRKAPGRA